jgi:hypothetical protein
MLDSHGIHRKFYFFRDNNKLSDYTLGFSLKNSLFLTKEEIENDSKNKEKGIKTFEKIEEFSFYAPFLIFYEGMSTNNTFVNNIDRFLLFQIFDEIKKNKLNLVLVKIYHDNKNLANGCENGMWHFIKCLFQLKNDVFVKFEVLHHNDIKVLDTIILSFKQLMNSDKKLCILEKEISYKQFLDYYKENK